MHGYRKIIRSLIKRKKPDFEIESTFENTWCDSDGMEWKDEVIGWMLEEKEFSAMQHHQCRDILQKMY
jgi:hypothetical protein